MEGDYLLQFENEMLKLVHTELTFTAVGVAIIIAAVAITSFIFII